MTTAMDIVQAGKDAVAQEVQYIYGAKPDDRKFQVYTLAEIRALRDIYGSACVWPSDDSKAGHLCCDCSGLITKATGIIKGSWYLDDEAVQKHTLKQLKADWGSHVGWGLYMKGHVGVVSDKEGYYYAMDGSARNAMHAPLSDQAWERAIQIRGVDYAVDSGIRIDIDTTAGAVHRVYNPNSGTHHFSTDINEVQNVISSGWEYEGVAWYAPTSGDVHRLLNPNNGDHLLTLDEDERDFLVKAGWKYEGVAFQSGRGSGVHRLYNPYNGLHHYTANDIEYRQLKKVGWKDEGVAFLTK